MVKGLEAGPIILSKHQHECREVERSVIADILVAASFRCCHVKIDDFGVDVSTNLEGSDEWTDVLEGSSTDKFGCWVFEEPIVHLRKLFGLVLYPCHLGDLGHLVCAGLSDFFLTVLRQIIVEWENLMLEEFE